MLDQPLIHPPVQPASFTKGQPLYTKNAMGAILKCVYEKQVMGNPDIYIVKVIEGDYKGTCYKSKDELFTEKPNQ